MEDQEWENKLISPAGASLWDKLGLEVHHYLPWDTMVRHRVGSTLGRLHAHLQSWCAHGAHGHGHGTWRQVTMSWDWCPWWRDKGFVL